MMFLGHVSSSTFKVFYDLCKALAKQGDDCIMRISPESIDMIVGNNVVTFASIETAKLLDSPVIKSKNDNVIGLLVHSGNLAKALHSGLSASDVTMKLTKRTGSPCLTIVSQCARDSKVTHEVHVRVMRPEELANISEPSLPPPKVRCFMPDLRRFQEVVNRLARLGDSYITLGVSSEGTLTLGTESDLVHVETSFNDLDVEAEDAGERPSVLRVSLDAKMLSGAAHIHAANPAVALCCPLPGMSLVLHAILRDEVGTVTMYIPSRLVPRD